MKLAFKMTSAQPDPHINPFATDKDRHAIWEMLVPRDIDAFIGQDWPAVDGDFDHAAFLGIDARRSADPDDWKLAFPTVAVYRDAWLRQASEMAAQAFAEDPRTAIFRATRLTEIEIIGDRALAHKKFDGAIQRADGSSDTLNWQTVYYCRRQGDRWLITGFTGYLPYTAER